MKTVHSIKQPSTNWIYAWKAASVFVTAGHPRTIRFMPIMIQLSYGIVDSAICTRRMGHIPPADGCRCGFNAWYDLDLALKYLSGRQKIREEVSHRMVHVPRSLALLRVGLHGSVIEGTLDYKTWEHWGYRASDQHVTDIFFGEQCTLCSAKAVGLALAREKLFLPDAEFLAGSIECRGVQPSCGRHDDFVILQPKQLMQHNNVGVHCGYPSE